MLQVFSCPENPLTKKRVIFWRFPMHNNAIQVSREYHTHFDLRYSFVTPRCRVGWNLFFITQTRILSLGALVQLPVWLYYCTLDALMTAAVQPWCISSMLQTNWQQWCRRRGKGLVFYSSLFAPSSHFSMWEAPYCNEMTVNNSCHLSLSSTAQILAQYSNYWKDAQWGQKSLPNLANKIKISDQKIKVLEEYYQGAH